MGFLAKNKHSIWTNLISASLVVGTGDGGVVVMTPESPAALHASLALSGLVFTVYQLYLTERRVCTAEGHICCKVPSITPAQPWQGLHHIQKHSNSVLISHLSSQSHHRPVRHMDNMLALHFWLSFFLFSFSMDDFRPPRRRKSKSHCLTTRTQRTPPPPSSPLMHEQWLFIIIKERKPEKTRAQIKTDVLITAITVGPL